LNFLNKLDQASQKNNSLLCIGLDIDVAKIPPSVKSKEDIIYTFNQGIIDRTHQEVCAYKPNSAFYEMYGLPGMAALIQTIEYSHSKNIPVILDAKRGDIGNSSAAYARAAFEILKADAITVNPYLGEDSLKPFLDYANKGIFILCLTSNPGAEDFQTPRDLYKDVAKKAVKWNKNNNCGLVVGATKPEQLKEIRKIVGDMPILIPGVGAQGGDLEQSVKAGINKNKLRAIINSSRGIIYNSDPAKAAKNLKEDINKYR
jgi:orotidine 5'-phosphate decarboxylase subfamily 2